MFSIRQTLCATVAALSACGSANATVQTPGTFAGISSDAACSVADLRPPFDFSKPVIVGEFHGTEQSGSVVTALICSAITSGRSVSLAVEMPPQAVEDVYSGPVTNQFWQSHPDGRASMAMRRLLISLSNLRRSGALEVVGFMGETVSDESSDFASAERIRRGVRPGDAVIVLVGNYHARRATEPSGQDTLPSVLGDVVNINIANSLPGTAWACMPECEVHAMSGSSGRLPLGISPVSAANGFDYYFVVETFTPSEPF
ncbi:hypothetical protein [Brevundimonas sp.]|uniref:hypothetical protein n=1 Tax=Brevundimonas sp. TaxID=1871086 RepID=UPI002488A00D|nr:hypothetical protein [Brevundimonas sp.]MDI1282701.1 hypothetical protein [Brevundimonas sp.]